MKAFLFTVCCFLLVHHVSAQEFQLINDYDRPLLHQPGFFYKSLPDSLINESVKTEYQALSDFFMVTTSRIYYDTSKTSDHDLITPDSVANPIFMNVNSVNSLQGTISAATIDKLVHQFAVIVIKKYKLDIPIESKIVLTDYLAGYYMACRNRISETKLGLKISNLDEGHEFNLVSEKVRELAYLQGENDCNSNHVKRKVFTLRDLLHSALIYVENLL